MKDIPQHLAADASMNRRTFVGRLGVATGGLVLAAVLPPGSVRCAAAAPTASPAAAVGDWEVDDMFVGFPRYAQPIGYAPPRTATLTAQADPIDHQFLV